MAQHTKIGQKFQMKKHSTLILKSIILAVITYLFLIRYQYFITHLDITDTVDVWQSKVHKGLPDSSTYFALPRVEDMRNLDIAESKKKFDTMRDKINKYKDWNVENKGRGIITVGHKFAIFELTSLVIHIRKYSKLPIEIFHWTDFDPKYIAHLMEFENIVMKDLTNSFLNGELPKDSRHHFTKPLAMMMTSFEEVLYIDSDAFPMFHTTPNIFDMSFDLLKRNDIVLFRDYWMNHPDNPIYKILEFDYMWQRQVDSGIVIYRKSKSLKLLAFAYYICMEGEFQKLTAGDKDAFWMGLMALKFYNMPAPILLINTDTMGYIGDSCQHGMFHHLNGQLGFAHFNGLKSLTVINQNNQDSRNEKIFCTRDTFEGLVPNDFYSKIKVGYSAKHDLKDDYSQRYSFDNCLQPISEFGVYEKKVDSGPIFESMAKAFEMLKKKFCLQ